MANLPPVSDKTWEAEVLKAPAAVVDFWGEGWGGCKLLAPVVEQVAKEYAGTLKVLGANIEEAGETAAGLGIFGIPALLFYKGGQEVHRVTGVVKKEKLVELIKAKLGV